MQTSKRLKYEGDAYSKAVQLMRSIGRNETSTFRLGTITAAPPEIKMLLDNDPIEYDKQDIYVAEHLTVHTRRMRIYDNRINGVTRVAANHVHGYDWIELQNAEVEYLDELKVGDRVLVECDDEKMKYIILDRVVSYA